jgi:NADPH2:quinone reductase
VSAAGVPVAYLTAQITLSLAGFQAGKTVLAPAIGGSVGNAVTQLARAQGAKHAVRAVDGERLQAAASKHSGRSQVADGEQTFGLRGITRGVARLQRRGR